MHDYFFLFRFSGGVDNSNDVRNNIIEFDPETEEWQEIGTMKDARAVHAVSVVSYSDYADWCETYGK